MNPRFVSPRHARPGRVVLATALLILAGCATPPSPPLTVPDPVVGKFSSVGPGEMLPSGWQVWQLSAAKKPTRYRLVADGGRTVVKASAQGSASGLSYRLRVDLNRHPLLHWRWKVPSLIAAADNTLRHAEDSPVRLIVTFDGDRTRLPFEERLFAQQFKLFTGKELPYATLMYIWENRMPRGSVIPNAHTARVKMIVAESGPAHVGQWRAQTRNVLEDYRRAFGEAPPPVRSIAIMTDTDNTGASVDAFYGDIAFLGADEAP